MGLKIALQEKCGYDLIHQMKGMTNGGDTLKVSSPLESYPQ